MYGAVVAVLHRGAVGAVLQTADGQTRLGDDVEEGVLLRPASSEEGQMAVRVESMIRLLAFSQRDMNPSVLKSQIFEMTKPLFTVTVNANFSARSLKNIEISPQQHNNMKQQLITYSHRILQLITEGKVTLKHQ